MPQYEYRNADETACDHCRDGFTVRQNVGDPALEICPQCGAAVTRVYSFGVNTRGKLTAAKAERAGFKMLRKTDEGYRQE